MTTTNHCSLIIVSFILLLTFSTASGQAPQPQGLQVNQSAPDFKTEDQNGNTIHLKSLLKKGPVVLIFYRGEWCPYCNKHLKQLEDSLSQITSKGAKVIAVTPQKPEFIAKTIEQTKASFSIVHDDGLNIMKSYDVAFKVDDKTIELYKKYKIDFNVINGEKNGTNLPVPAVFVINKRGKITYRFFDPNYKVRAPISAIAKHL